MPTDQSALIFAIQTFNSMGQQIQATQQSIANVNLGPFQIDVSCSHGFLGIYQDHYTERVDFGIYRPRFESALAWAAGLPNSFQPIGQAMNQWCSGPLQEISKAMTDLRAQSQGSGGVAQKQIITISVRATVTLLQQAQGSLNQVVQSQAAFSQQMTSFYQSLADTQQQLKQNMATVTQNVSDNIAGWACGTGNGYDQLGIWQATFTASTNSIATSVGNLNGFTDQAVAGLAHLTGRVFDTLSQFEPVADQFEASQDPDISKHLAALHIDVACDLWASLAASVAK